MASLAPALHDLSPLTLMLMTVALGRLFVLPDDDGRGDVRRFGPAPVGRIVAAGFDLLSGWPTRLRDRVSTEMASLVDRSHGEHRAFLAKVRALGDPRNTPDGQAAVVRTAMPEIFEHASRALRIGRDVLGGAELSRLTGLSSAQLGLLRDGDALPFAVLREGERIGAQYSRAEAERLNSSLRSSHPSSRVERRFGLPHYAVEQAVCTGLLEMEDHPGAAALGLGLRIRDGSADDLENAIMARALRGMPSPDAMPLDRAVRAIGGRRKPWGVILSDAAAGSLPFWIADRGSGAPLTARMLVRRDSIDRFLDVEFVRPAEPPFPFATSVSQRDACEILNLNSLLIRPAVESGLLTMTPGPKKSFAHPLQEVLALAAEIIAAAEIAPRVGVRENNVRKWIADNLVDVSPAVVGWPRNAIIQGLDARSAPIQTRTVC
ncbi:hypothetical protein [Sphingomonas oligoaromativorans]|uniref:hypothetical protein n=1 Tax=Sphingomonas oligoaromativorans TaxID=575322 RepID=UPI001420D10C|nr:hypothetical protein [Sphingomonas oligoaromativorans]NIJ33356.1 hypothetical protein [Sphingomonas oligoaromativorans]